MRNEEIFDSVIRQTAENLSTLKANFAKTLEARSNFSKLYNLFPRLIDLIETKQEDVQSRNAHISTSVWNYGGVSAYIYVPWDTVFADKVMVRFTKLGWELTGEFDNIADAKSKQYVFRHPELPDVDIRIVMEAELAGSKCELIIESYRTKEIPVYKIVCKDEINV